MKPTNFATTDPVARGNSTQQPTPAPARRPHQDRRQHASPKGIPAIVRSISGNQADTQNFVHSGSDVIIPQPHKQRIHQLEDYVASIRDLSQHIASETVPNQNRQQSTNQVEFSAHDSEAIESLLKQLNRVDAPHASATAGPHIPAAEFPELDQGPATNPTSPVAESRKEADRAELVHAIATAVASVLTDLPDAQLEQKLEQHFAADAKAEAPLATSPTPVAPKLASETVVGPAKLAPVAMSQPEITGTPAAEPVAVTAQNQPATGRHQSFPEIPAAAAAWDVDAFRWPLLSNQLIASAADSIQQLYDHVQASTDDLANHQHTPNQHTPKRIAVTGVGRGEGYSSITISLARWAAASGNSVLIIDADLASPDLTTAVGLERGLSWVDGIGRQDNPAEVIVRSKNSNICVMPLAPIQSRTNAPTLLYNALGSFLGAVEKHFDWIIIDAGPGSQLLAELSRPELLLDLAVLVGGEDRLADLQNLQTRLQAIGLDRFVVAQNSVEKREAA